MSADKRGWRWPAVFGLLFLLSQDLWFWGEDIRLGPGNFPLRIYYFVLLQLALAALLALFVRRLLRRKPGTRD
jgi:hypothetical protein